MTKRDQRRCWVCNAPILWGKSDTACKVSCRNVLYAESYRLAKHKEEAYRKGLAYDLTLEAWAVTLRHFCWRCAYCGGPFESLDHFVPVHLGGGTGIGNCVPACLVCNQQRKGGQRPDEITELPHDVLEQIARYLEQRVRSTTK
jgi:5-methylcytosine-specific restriction endonuclease McrA